MKHLRTQILLEFTICNNNNSKYNNNSSGNESVKASCSSSVTRFSVALCNNFTDYKLLNLLTFKAKISLVFFLLICESVSFSIN